VKHLTRIAILGLGKMGLLHLRNCRHMDGVKVDAAADTSEALLKRAGAEGVPALYRDYNDLINKAEVDAFIIALPNHLHYRAVKLAAEAGKHVLVEKPLANSSRECEELLEISRKSGIVLMVAHNYRFIRSVQKIKEVYDRGHIGEAEAATLELVINGPFAPSFEPVPVPEWYFDPSRTGMGCLDSGYHLIDLFNWFFGECDVCYAKLGHRYNLPYEDSAILIVKAKHGPTKGIINVGWYSRMIFPRFNFRVILHGTEGYLSTDSYSPRNFYAHAAKEMAKNSLRRMLGLRIRPLTYTYYYESYFRELELFLDSVRKGSQPPVTAEDAVHVLKTIEQAYEISNSREELSNSSKGIC